MVVRLRARHAITSTASFSAGIDPDFWFAFVHLGPASDFDTLSFYLGQNRRLVNRRCRRDPASESLVWIGGADIEERVSAFRGDKRSTRHSVDGNDPNGVIHGGGIAALYGP